MPRAYGQIVALLARFKGVRDSLATLSANLQQVMRST